MFSIRSQILAFFFAFVCVVQARQRFDASQTITVSNGGSASTRISSTVTTTFGNGVFTTTFTSSSPQAGIETKPTCQYTFTGDVCTSGMTAREVLSSLTRQLDAEEASRLQ